MAINTLDDFKRYCCRKLGAPVVNIDITDEQMDDRFYDAMDKFHEYHADGSERVYIKYQVTAQDVINKYIPMLDPRVIAVARVLPISSMSANNSSQFSYDYQIKSGTVWDMTSLASSGGLSYYVNMRQYTSLIDQILNGSPIFKFNHYTDKVIIEEAWGTKINEGDWIVMDVFRTIDHTTNIRVLNDPWLKKYTTALFKMQWGTNLSKFQGVQLIGGAVIDGNELYDEAMNEIAQLEEELENVHQLPVDMMMG